MSWLFSQALVEEYLVDTSLDGEQSAPLSGNPTQQAYCAPDKMTGFSRLSRFGMTYKPLTESLGEELLTLYLVDSHVKTSQQREKALDLMEPDLECGITWHGWLAKYDPSSCSWKTPQCSLLGEEQESLEILPKWGMTVNGLLWELPMLEQTTKEIAPGSLLPTPVSIDAGSGRFNTSVGSINQRPTLALIARKNLWPTPKTRDYKDGRTEEIANRHSPDLEKLVGQSLTAGALNPTWVEWLMGWPLGWTDLKPLETGKSHCAPQQHGDY